MLLSDTVSHLDSYFKNMFRINAKSVESLVNQFRSFYEDKLIANVNQTVQVDDYETLRLIEIDLLSKCDQMIVTGGSTFAYIAVFKSGRFPFVVNGGRNMTKCFKANLTNPGKANPNFGFLTY